MDLGREGGIQAKPADDVLGRVRIPRGEGCVPERVTVHHRGLGVEEAPRCLGTRPQVEDTREERPTDIASFQKETVWIPFLNFQTEWDTNQAKPQLQVPRGTLPAHLDLGPRQPEGHAAHRASLELEHGAEGATVGFNGHVRPSNEESLGVERRSPRGRKLILGRLVHHHGIGLQEATEREIPILSFRRSRGPIGQGRIGRRDHVRRRGETRSAE